MLKEKNKKYRPHLDKINCFINDLIAELQSDMADIHLSKNKSTILVKKNITDTMTRLVGLISLLNKFAIDDEKDNTNSGLLIEEDKKIIANFIEKHAKVDKNAE